MCIMRWIIVNCLLLASIVVAAPDGRHSRHKRHLSYIKDFITSTLFGSNQETLKLEPDAGYRLYEVPGFDDIIIKAIPKAPVEEEIVYQPGEVMEINPFESYIGTSNPEETLATFDNVNNLLSLGLLNGQETTLMKKTMVPMISGLNTVKLVSEDVIPVPLSRDTVQPLVTEFGKPNEVKVKFQEKFEPSYYSYRQMENNEPVVTFSAHTTPDVTVQTIDRSSVLPKCVEQRVNEVVSLGANPAPIVASPVNEPWKIGLTTQIGYVPRQISVPITSPVLSLRQFNKKFSDENARLSKATSIKVDDGYPKHGTNKDHIEILQTLGPMPPQYIAIVPELSTDIKSEDKATKTISHFSYKHVKNNPGAVKLTTEKDKAKINDGVLIPPVVHFAGENKSGESIKKDNVSNKVVSHFVYTQVTHNKSNEFEIAKEKDEAKTTTNMPLPNNQGNESTSVSTTPAITVIKKEKDIDEPAKNNKTETLPKNEEPKDTVTEKETLTDYINERKSEDNPKQLMIAKEKDEAKTNVHAHSSIPNNYVFIPPINTPPIVHKDDTHTAKESDKVPEKGTLSYYIYKHMGHHPPAFSLFEEANKAKTNLQSHSLADHYVYIPPSINVPSPTNVKNTENVSHKTNSEDRTMSMPYILRPLNNGSASGSHYSYKQISHNDTNLNSFKEGDDLKTNVPTESVSTSMSTSTEAYTEAELFTNKVTVTESSTATVITERTTENSISFKNNPIVVADSNYEYHQSNPDGSTMKFKGMKDGVSIDVKDKDMTRRGDIPDQ